jgi:hypothetical protein
MTTWARLVTEDVDVVDGIRRGHVLDTFGRRAVGWSDVTSLNPGAEPLDSPGRLRVQANTPAPLLTRR